MFTLRVSEGTKKFVSAHWDWRATGILLALGLALGLVLVLVLGTAAAINAVRGLHGKESLTGQSHAQVPLGSPSHPTRLLFKPQLLAKLRAFNTPTAWAQGPRRGRLYLRLWSASKGLSWRKLRVSTPTSPLRFQTKT